MSSYDLPQKLNLNRKIKCDNFYIINVISCKFVHNISGEHTLDFETILDNNLKSITKDANIIYDGYKFMVRTINKKIDADGITTIAVACDHIIYKLNKIPYIQVEWFKNNNKKPVANRNKIFFIDEKIEQISGGDTNGHGFEGYITEVSSKNLPTIEIVYGGTGYDKDDIVEFHGVESGATSKFKVSLVSNGSIYSIEQPNGKIGVKKKEWKVGTEYSQEYTDGKGNGFRIKVVAVQNDDGNYVTTAGASGSNPKGLIVARGTNYKVGDTIIFGKINDLDEELSLLASTTVIFVGYSTYSSSILSSFLPSAVGGISNISDGASIPAEDIKDIKDDNSLNYNFTGTIEQIFKDIFRGNLESGTCYPLGEFGDLDNPNAKITFTSSATRVLQILQEFIVFLHDKFITARDFLVFNDEDNTFGIVTIGDVVLNIDADDCKNLEINVDYTARNLNNELGTTTFNITPGFFPLQYIKGTLYNFYLSDTITIKKNDIMDDKTLRVVSLEYNPYDFLDVNIQVSDTLVYKNLSNTIQDLFKFIIGEKALQGISSDNSNNSNQLDPSSLGLGDGSGGSGGGGANSDGYGNALDQDGNLVSVNDTLDPLIANNFLATQTNSVQVVTSKLVSSYIESPLAKLTDSTNDIIITPNEILSTEPTTIKTESAKYFTLAYGGAGYEVGNQITVKGLLSGTQATVTIKTISTNMIAAYVATQNSKNSNFILSEYVYQSDSSSGQGFIGIVRAINDNSTVVISPQSGGTGYTAGSSITVTGQTSGARISLNIKNIISGVVAEIEPTLVPEGWLPIEVGLAQPGNMGGGAGLKVYASPFMSPTPVGEEPPPEPESIHQAGFEFPIVVRQLSEDSDPINKRLVTFRQFNKNKTPEFSEDLKFNMDLSNKVNNKTNLLGVEKDANSDIITFIPNDFVNIIIMDHKPTKKEVLPLANDTLIFVYDPSQEVTLEDE
ncbi:MAG: hypothetical protein LBD57_04285 [Endomicrobium sp.]|jgi:hypothetical protein|uniref:hypothetical protein n=1 Tax=Candidatus Endomicrobiellum cubanum TaxID=3242325 RepID=UPI0028274B23|nr:hypothetical protein [Endomicrobium sp.]